MRDMRNLLYSLGIVPVVKLDDAGNAALLARALVTGELPLVEVTFRTAAAAESIRRIRAEVPEMLVGAGTVTSTAKAREALDAGAGFIVTPGFNPEVAAWCVDNGITVFPGCTTASEVEAAMNLGLDIVKFFPAEQSGGLAKIKALCGPYPSMRFMPTGGINLKNMAEYLAFPKIFACGGSFMAPDDALRNGRWEEISALATQAVSAAQGYMIDHVGIHTRDGAEAGEAKDAFARITGLETRDFGPSFFVGTELEIMKTPAVVKGCLTYSVINAERGFCRLEGMGFAIDEATVRRNRDGERVSGCLKGVFHGFTVRIQGR